MESRGPDDGWHDLDELLRLHRPSPSSGFVTAVKRSLRPRRRRGAVPSSRLVFVTALCVLALGVFASFGGVSYAAHGIGHGVASVKAAVTGPRVVHHSPATDQYHTPPPIEIPGGGGVSGAGGGGGGVSGAGGGGAGAQPAAMGNLPFTGFPVIFTSAIGFGLILIGLMLRRREQRV
jgi:hypothetical protein